MTAFAHASASQADTWQDCRAGWGWSRIRAKAPNPYAEFGDRAHVVGENYLRDGTPPPSTPEGECIMAGLEYLPLPGTCLQVEGRLEFVTDGDRLEPWQPDANGVDLREAFGWVHYTGRVDFLYGWDPARIVVVGDHKTTGNLEYRKTPETLSTHAQWLIYARWASWIFQVPNVAGHWQYYRRKPPKSEPTLLVEAVDAIAAKFRELHHRVVLPMVRSAGVNPHQLPKDGIEKGLCDRWYGKPCPYRDECLSGVSAIERAAAALRGIEPNMSNLLATLQSLNPGAAAAQAQPQQQFQQAPPQAAPAQEQVPPDMMAILNDPSQPDTVKQMIAQRYGLQMQAPAAPQAPPQQYVPAQPVAIPAAPAPQQQAQAPAQLPQAWQPQQAAPAQAPAAAPRTRAPSGKSIKLDRGLFLTLQSFIPGRTVADANAWADAIGLTA